MRHKLATFILKNPPKSKKVRGGKKAVAGADSIAGQPAQMGGGNGGNGSDDDDADELTKKIEAGAAEIMTDAQAAALIRQREAEDDWSIDTSKEAVAARVSQLDAKLQSSLVLGPDDDDEEGGGPYEAFGEMIRDQRASEGGMTDAEVYKKAEEQGLAKKHKLLVVLVQALFTEDIVNEIPSHLALFAKVSHDRGRALSLLRSGADFSSRCVACRSGLVYRHDLQLTTSEKHQKSLLGGIERLVGEQYPALIPEVPKILMAFYQADVLEEEVLTQWGTHVSKKVSAV